MGKGNKKAKQAANSELNRRNKETPPAKAKEDSSSASSSNLKFVPPVVLNWRNFDTPPAKAKEDPNSPQSSNMESSLPRPRRDSPETEETEEEREERVQNTTYYHEIRALEILHEQDEIDGEEREEQNEESSRKLTTTEVLKQNSLKELAETVELNAKLIEELPVSDLEKWTLLGIRIAPHVGEMRPITTTNRDIALILAGQLEKMTLEGEDKISRSEMKRKPTEEAKRIIFQHLLSRLNSALLAPIVYENNDNSEEDVPFDKFIQTEGGKDFLRAPPSDNIGRKIISVYGKLTEKNKVAQRGTTSAFVLTLMGPRADPFDLRHEPFVLGSCSLAWCRCSLHKIMSAYPTLGIPPDALVLFDLQTHAYVRGGSRFVQLGECEEENECEGGEFPFSVIVEYLNKLPNKVIALALCCAIWSPREDKTIPRRIAKKNVVWVNCALLGTYYYPEKKDKIKTRVRNLVHQKKTNEEVLGEMKKINVHQGPKFWIKSKIDIEEPPGWCNH